jgi:hypothetical protein
VRTDPKRRNALMVDGRGGEGPCHGQRNKYATNGSAFSGPCEESDFGVMPWDGAMPWDGFGMCHPATLPPTHAKLQNCTCCVRLHVLPWHPHCSPELLITPGAAHCRTLANVVPSGHL